MYDFKKILGKNIKNLREKLNLSQDLLSEKMSISAKSISYIENGRHFAAPETLTSLCENLNCLPFELFRVSELTKSENHDKILSNIIQALNSCDTEQLKNIEKYIYNMILDEK